MRAASLLQGCLQLLQLVHVGLCLRPKLQLLFMYADHQCTPSPRLFRPLETISKTTAYVTSLEPRALLSREIQLMVTQIDGCNAKEFNRGFRIFEALDAMADVANRSRCFTVFLGPPLGADCVVTSDWTIYTSVDTPSLLRPYQISYNCPSFSLARQFIERNRVDQYIAEEPNYASVFITLNFSATAHALKSLLQFQGWRRVFLLFEISDSMTSLLWLTNSIKLAFKDEQRFGPSVDIVSYLGIRENMNYTALLYHWIKRTDAILLLSHPSLAVAFLHGIKAIPEVVAGRVAVIHFDPSDAIAYDVLRSWRLELSTSRDLGAAGQCLLIVTTLPYGTGFNVSSPLLQSRTMVSLASAVALAVSMVKTIIVETNATWPPLTANLFAPLLSNHVRVPVAPSVELHFSRSDDDVTDWNDIYVFQLLTENVYDESFSITDAAFDDVFEIASVILTPGGYVTEVAPFRWPANGSGPYVDTCFQINCLGKVDTIKGLVLASELAAASILAIIIAIFFRRHENSLKLRMGSNKLVLYPDDVIFLKPKSAFPSGSYNENSVSQIFPTGLVGPAAYEISCDSEIENTMEVSTTSEVDVSRNNGAIAIFNQMTVHCVTIWPKSAQVIGFLANLLPI
ncbi:unnamed protein product [Mesocestoides corti]|uniref:Receptor ligand binding region domain-containing protein n=2 Tax=Mesocestoides corti TaxID=53468 RepID=A0A0R3UQU9_MESCO|nr:unnamed protein product [Mesocestoides corti]